MPSVQDGARRPWSGPSGTVLNVLENAELSLTSRDLNESDISRPATRQGNQRLDDNSASEYLSFKFQLEFA